MKEIKIGSGMWRINYSQDVAQEVLDKIIEWTDHPDHYASHSGEGIMQSDNTIIDAPELISDIVDDILNPTFIDQ